MAIKQETLEIAAKTNIAFMTDFWTSPASESFMTMSMDWIRRDWPLKARILGTVHFPRKHSIASIFGRLLHISIDFGVWPKDVECRIPQSEEPLRSEKLAYFRMELPLDRPMLTSDSGSDVSVGAEKTTFGIGIVVRVAIWMMQNGCTL